MEHYVTLFDNLFLPQGLALHLSMERHIKEYKLWVLCVDDVVYEVLGRLNLPNLCRLQLSKLETAELLYVKSIRTKKEYCWTLTPFTPRFVFEADPTVKRVTYIDADLWFRKHPAPIFRELVQSGKQVLIMDHAFTPEYDQSASSGQYCVQFMTFTSDASEPVRKWWEERCIEWCYARCEDGKFGDQKYLDDFPILFGDLVHVLENKELALAPWNMQRYPYGNSVFVHFHSFRYGKYIRLAEGYELPKVILKYIYRPYIADILQAISNLKKVSFTPILQHNDNLPIAVLKSLGKCVLRFARSLHSYHFIQS